jgi:hypothetical protein
MKKSAIFKTIVCVVLIVIAYMLIKPGCSEAQKKYKNCSTQSVKGKEWISFWLKIDNQFNELEERSSCCISYQYNKHKSRMFVNFIDNQVCYMITRDSICVIDAMNREISVFHNRINFNNTYFVMKRHVFGLLRFLPYYTLNLPFYMRLGLQKSYIYHYEDAVFNEKPRICFNGVTQKVFRKKSESDGFTEPLQYEFQTWINSDNYLVDSILAYNSTQNDFKERIIYRLYNYSFEDKSVFYDSLFDLKSVKYDGFCTHTELSLPYNMTVIAKEELFSDLWKYPLVSLNGDTVKLEEQSKWVLLDLWQFGCRGCCEGFEKMRKEKDSLGYCLIETEGVRIIAVNALSDNWNLIAETAKKYCIEDILFSAKGINTTIALVGNAYPSYYLISPQKEVVWRSNRLDYSGLLNAKKAYEQQQGFTPGIGIRDSCEPSIFFEDVVFNFDTISIYESVEHVFDYSNKGMAPLLITSAFSSCGCVIPEWSKQPIGPNEKGCIRVRYYPNKTGSFTKAIVVKSNDESFPQIVLRINGFVLNK